MLPPDIKPIAVKCITSYHESKPLAQKIFSDQKNVFLSSEEWLSLSVKLSQGGKNEQF
jgi:hypothetical protein